MTSHDSHNAPSARYRQPVDRSDQRRAFADKINGGGGSAGKLRGADKRFRPTRENRATPARTSLNPADAWPFTRSEPESDQEWRNNAPEAAF